MQDDVVMPPVPPRKRRHLESPNITLDKWLATWASDETLASPHRHRAQKERDRRKALKPDRIIGIVLDESGATPEQLETLRDCLAKARPTEIHHPYAARSLNAACKATGAKVIVHSDVRDPFAPLKAVVLASELVIGVPRSMEGMKGNTPAWQALYHAKHRSLETTVVLPDGTIKGDA